MTLNGTNSFNENDEQGLVVNAFGAVTLNNVTAILNGWPGGSDVPGVSINNQVDPAVQQNVLIKGTNTFIQNAFDGLCVLSYGMVSLSNVTANENGNFTSDNIGSGVYVDNSLGNHGKPVTLIGTSTFSQNDSDGLHIISDGVVTTNNLSAHDNFNGVFIDNHVNLAVNAAVTLNGYNVFNNNSGRGLNVESNGTIKLNNATALNNLGRGIYLDNDTASIPQNVILTGSLTAVGNGIHGLYVSSDGVVTASNLTAASNGSHGVYINNSGAASPKPVTISGNNLMNDNASTGLDILSRGAITLNNLTAIGNGVSTGYDGVYLFNQYDPAVQQNVTLNGVNVMNLNGVDGLFVLSYGTVTLSNLTANGNGYATVDTVGDGIFIDNSSGAKARPVTLRGFNTFKQNDSNGMVIYSDGAVTLSNLTAFGNEGYGVYVDNTNLAVQSRVTLNGFGLFESNWAVGLYIASNGSVVTSNLNANDNGGTGAYIDTMGLTGLQTVTLNGTNNFNYNSNGLYVASDGNIRVNNLTASHNANNGAYLDNWDNWAFGFGAPKGGSLTLTGFGTFTDNTGSDGLVAWSNGAVSLTRVTADFNGSGVNDHGIHIYSDSNVTLMCSGAYGNYDIGLYVQAAVNLTLKGLRAYANGTNEDLTGVSGTVTRTYCP